MKRISVIRWILGAIVGAMGFSANANSVGLYNPSGVSGGQLTITVYYDFNDFSMFGGGADLVYDPATLEFVNYTQEPLPQDAQDLASPVGELTYPGLYSGLGIGTFEWFFGMNSAGEIGTFVFNVLHTSQTFSGCGDASQHDYFTPLQFVCLTPNAINPMVSLVGDNVTEELFLAGNGTYIPPVPVPAAVWLMLGGLGVLFGMRTS